MKDYFVKLFGYENWANKEVADSLLKIKEPPEKIIMLISHIINAQTLWLERMKKVPQSVAVWYVYEKEELQEAMYRSASGLTDFINKVSEKDLENTVEYSNTKGEKYNSKLIDILTHLLLHSAYHRGQVISLMKRQVSALPYTDYIHFARKIEKQ